MKRSGDTKLKFVTDNLEPLDFDPPDVVDGVDAFLKPDRRAMLVQIVASLREECVDVKNRDEVLALLGSAANHVYMAVRFLREQKAIARSRLRRRNPQAYRNDFYATIHASAKSLGWTDQQIYEFAEEKLEKKPIRSLRKLGPIQLKKLAGCISRMANRDSDVKENSSQLSAEQSRSAVA